MPANDFDTLVCIPNLFHNDMIIQQKNGRKPTPGVVTGWNAVSAWKNKKQFVLNFQISFLLLVIVSPVRIIVI